MASRTRLKDIAAEANLSVAAVSMALRGHPSIPEQTAARVKKIAERMGYAPDPVMSALAAHRSRLRVHREFNVIALVSNWPSSARWLKYNLSARLLMAGASERARTLGFSLQFFNAWGDGMTPHRLSDVLHARGIRGLVVAPLADPSGTFEIDWNRFSAVTIERPEKYGFYHHVVPNYYADMCLTHRVLHEKGYRRPGLVLDSHMAERVGHQWEAAHLICLSHLNTEAIPAFILRRDAGSQDLLKWYSHYRPDVVIGRSSVILKAFRENDIRMPEQVGYASLNALDDEGNVSGIRQPREVMGAAAIDILNSLLLRNHRGPDTSVIGTLADGSWYEGETLPEKRGEPDHAAWHS